VRALDRCLAPSTAGDEGCGNMTIIMVQFKKPIASTFAEEQSSQSDLAASESKPEES